MAGKIPAQLNEWLEWAKRINTAALYNRNDYRQAALRLTDAEVTAMGELYNRAQDNNDMAVLTEWLISNAGHVPMDADELAIRNLLHLWLHLNTQAYKRFSREPVLRLGEESRATPDWSKLPLELKFLATPALQCSKFTYSHSEEGREHIVETTTSEEKEELALVAEQVRKVGYVKVREWLSTLKGGNHVEFYLVSNLIAVLDALDLPYFSPKP